MQSLSPNWDKGVVTENKKETILDSGRYYREKMMGEGIEGHWGEKRDCSLVKHSGKASINIWEKHVRAKSQRTICAIGMSLCTQEMETKARETGLWWRKWTGFIDDDSQAGVRSYGPCVPINVVYVKKYLCPVGIMWEAMPVAYLISNAYHCTMESVISPIPF